MPSLFIGALILTVMALVSIGAPILGTVSPTKINPSMRNKLPGHVGIVRLEDGTQVKHTHWMGTDSLGRDVYSRVLYGGRISLLIGVSVAVVSVFFGLALGVFAGFFRVLDNVIMRIMDGLMAIPSILLALSMVSLLSAGLATVIIAVAVTEIPRVVRLVRSVVLSVREEPYVEAAISTGTPTHLLIWRHVLPNTISPLVVQATYTVAHAMLIEATLSFLGIGMPTDVPTWGNIMAEGRDLFRIFPHNIIYPGIFLAITVLAVNMFGDGLRDMLDPRSKKRL